MRTDPRERPAGEVQIPQAPPAPNAPPTFSVGRLDVLSYGQLKARQAELQDQRQLLADRRANVAGNYEKATGASKDGIGARLAVMDKSMVQIESELSSVGLAMVPKRPQTGRESVPPPRDRGPNNAAPVLVMGAGVFFAMLFFFVPAAVRRAKRRWLHEAGIGGTNAVGAGSERLDRIEHAVDAIAIEIERVSENQRFMTRLMTETQLAGTIAAVRSSAEAAKSEAAG